MKLSEMVYEKSSWLDYYEFMLKRGDISDREAKELLEYIDSQRFVKIADNSFSGELPFPERREINKSGTQKKRVVYTYPDEFNIFFKMIAYNMRRYDYVFCDNCYAFRSGIGVKQAVDRLREIRKSELCSFKSDVSDYFNSINEEVLIEKLWFVKEDDEKLYRFFVMLLTQDISIVNGEVLHEKRGAMAGVPLSTFFANVYMSDIDKMFKDEHYFRYSDDILIFAKEGDIQRLKDRLYKEIDKIGLRINPLKEKHYSSLDKVEYLGLEVSKNDVDLSPVSLYKLKAKIKRKARALRRWAHAKNIPYERAAKGFINSMNKRLYKRDETDFCWCRWFFPVITTDRSLKEIDGYIVQNARYCITGKNNKGNYKISYDEIKEWGFRSVVNEYYKFKKG